MTYLAKLIAFVSGRHRIATGRAAGLKIAAQHARAFAGGTYEKPIQDAIADNLAAGDVFYDIGANVGFFSLIAARRVGDRGRVYAFEPVPQNAAAIKRSATLNQFQVIEVFAVAVAAETGQSELLLARCPGGASLASADTPPDLVGKMTVNVVNVDGVIEERGLAAPTLVKIDVEGAEIDVLRGMAHTLRDCRPTIIYEIDDESLSGLEKKAVEIAEFLKGFTYELTVLPEAYNIPNWHIRHVLATPSQSH